MRRAYEVEYNKSFVYKDNVVVYVYSNHIRYGT